ncbi:hypothetical protein EB052_01500 [bacterium]|nr:hypothetical protein [bacterium]
MLATLVFAALLANHRQKQILQKEKDGIENAIRELRKFDSIPASPATPGQLEMPLPRINQPNRPVPIKPHATNTFFNA